MIERLLINSLEEVLKKMKRVIGEVTKDEKHSKKLDLECVFILKFRGLIDPLLKYLDKLDIFVLSLCNSFLWKSLEKLKRKGTFFFCNPHQKAANKGHFKLAYWLGNQKLFGHFEVAEIFTINLEKIHKSPEKLYEEKKFQGMIIQKIIETNDPENIHSVLFKYSTLNGNNYLMNWLLSLKKGLELVLGRNDLENFGRNANYDTLNILYPRQYLIAYENYSEIYNGFLENFNCSSLRHLERLIVWEPSNFSHAVKHKVSIKNLQWLLDQRFSFDHSSCKSAAKIGDLDVLKWLRSKGCPWDEETISSAANKGHLKVLKWAFKNGCPINSMASYYAAKGNHLDILQFLLKKKQCQLSDEIFQLAASSGSLEMLIWLKENQCPISKPIICPSIKVFTQKDCEKLKWMVEENLIQLEDIRLCCEFGLGCDGIILDEGCYYSRDLSVMIGLPDISFMDWLFVNGAKWNVCLTNNILSTRKGNVMLDWIKWSMKHGCPKIHFPSQAALIGDIEILKFLKENDFEFNESTFISGVKSKKMDVLIWLKENNCPWNEKVCIEAVRNNSLDILKWLHFNECPWNEEVCSIAANCGYLEILEWSRENGCLWDQATTCNSFTQNNWRCFFYALKNNCPIIPQIIKKATKIGFDMSKLIPDYNDILLFDSF